MYMLLQLSVDYYQHYKNTNQKLKLKETVSMSFDSSSQFQSSSEESRVIARPKNITEDISILKHIPEPRSILEGHNFQAKYNYPHCLYQNQLSSIPQFVIPTAQPQKQKQALSNTNLQKNIFKMKDKINYDRLARFEQTLAEHQIMKENVQNILKSTQITDKKQPAGTLWGLYSSRTPSYSRFGNTLKKNNFANVIMNINGICIPNTKNKLQNGNNPTSEGYLNKIDLSPDSVIFDSHFESGNLLFAYRSLDQNIETYDLILQNDTNTRGHNQWFYFRIRNLKRHNQIKINIINFIKDSSLFSYGIKPLIFSEKDYHCNGRGWRRDGQKINYYQNKIRRQFNGKQYYTATFEYCFKQLDTVYFAPTYPYLYSQLSRFLNNLLEDSEQTKLKFRQLSTKQSYGKYKEFSEIFTIKNLSQTVGKNSISLITISLGKKLMSDSDCKVVWIFGRQHPAQTSASYMIQGIINYLLQIYRNPSKQFRDLLGQIIFKIVPIVNADGVIHGNTRAQLTGVDPNRMWKKPLKRLCPQISALKKAIGLTKSNVSLALDLHSHSKKLGCFFYGNSLMHDPKMTKIYPTLVCESDHRFSIKNCRFRGGYETTARSVIFHQLSIPNIYTVQCSLIGYLSNNRIIEFKIEDYEQMGRLLIKAYLNLEITKKQKKQVDIIYDLGSKIPERDEADSARSQSSLSDEQYEEILRKNISKKRNKKIRKCTDNSCSQNHYFLGKNHNRVKTLNKISSTTLQNKTQRQSSTNNLKSNKARNNQQENRQKKQSRPVSTKNKILEQISINRIKTQQQVIKSKKSTNIPLIIPKIQLRNQCREKIRQAHERQKIKILTLKQMKSIDVQVNFIGYSEDNDLVYNKIKNRINQDEQYLCVVGSSIQDQFITHVRNQVGTQVYPFIIKQPDEKDLNVSMSHKNSLAITQKQKRSAKLMPKIMNYLCSNLIGVKKENQLFLQQKKFGVFRSRKFY